MYQDVDVTDLEPRILIARAAHRLGVSPDAIDFIQFSEGLAHLTAAIDSEAHLTISGRERAAAALSAALATQLRVRRAVAADPGITNTAIRPIVITGLYRSGTTFLQHLLAQHPGMRSLRLWELMTPASDEQPAALIDAAQRYVSEYYDAAPTFRDVHELGAELPEECHRLLGVTFTSSIYALRYRIPSYVEWLNGQPMQEAYLYHRLLLQCLVHRSVDVPIVLKCPTHLWHLDDLATVYPNAKVIRVHRSPVDAIPSVCSLTDIVRSARATDVNGTDIGAYWLERTATVLDRMAGETPGNTRSLDVRYRDLVTDPIRIAGLICDYVDVPLTDEAAKRMRMFLRGQSRRTAAHAYRAEHFGLSKTLLASRFADYIAQYELSPV